MRINCCPVQVPSLEVGKKRMEHVLPQADFPPPGYRPTVLNYLLVNALDLTAPASDALLKNRKNAWVQLAGHPGSFAPAGPHTIWKKRLMKENNETVAYRQLMTDVVRDLVPCFYREVEYNGDFFIEMEDLLQHFQNPSIMDIKMGTRTFLESEVKNPVLRKDLYDKMVKIDPNEPTEEEHAQKSITKLRYMQFREKGSSTTNLGFRLEAIRMAGEVPNTDLKKVKSRTQVVERMTKYLDGKRDVQRLLTKRLKEIRDKFDISEFLKSREIIGSSLLFMYDHKGHAKVWMIDFAKTLPVENCIITHRDTWQLGNHEDGYLSGLENLIDIMEEVGRGMEESSCSRPSCEAASNGTDLQTRHRSHDDSLEKTLASSNPTHSKVNNLDKT